MAELIKSSWCSFLCCHWTAFESQFPPPCSETERNRYTFSIATAPCCSLKKPECPNSSSPACHCFRVLRLAKGHASFTLGREELPGHSVGLLWKLLLLGTNCVYIFLNLCSLLSYSINSASLLWGQLHVEAN